MGEIFFGKVGEHMTESQNTSFHSFSGSSSKNYVGTIFLFLLAIILGISLGYILSHQTNKTSTTATQNASGSSVATGSVYGSNDIATFKDSATGVVQKGGISGEGQYHLVRPGGDSQNVYMTSSLVDLSLFVGKKVKVNGQTQTAKTAGWLMDVGRVEVLQ